MKKFSQRLGWVPNLFTLGNLSLGFFAAIIAANGHKNPGAFALAGTFIFIAALADGLDGWTARLLNARSEVGAQLDSLADLTTFGIAPGVLAYHMAFYQLNIPIGAGGATLPAGMLISAIFPATAAYRLARFNVVHQEGEFAGLPSPVAGVIIALLPVIAGGGVEIPVALFLVLFIFLAFLMVSTIRYSKPQVSFVRRFSSLRLALLVVALVVALLYAWFMYGFHIAAAGLFLIGLVYIGSGLVALIIHFIQEYRV